MTRRQLATLLWATLTAWAATILWLSSRTPEQLPAVAFVASDKFNHFAAFGVGGWLAASSLRASWPRARTAAQLLVAALVVAAFGAIDEISQLATPGRSGADLYDWIADFLGAVCGASLARFTHAILDRFIARP